MRHFKKPKPLSPLPPLPERADIRHLIPPPSDDDLVEDVCPKHGKQRFYRMTGSGTVCPLCAREQSRTN